LKTREAKAGFYVSLIAGIVDTVFGYFLSLWLVGFILMLLGVLVLMGAIMMKKSNFRVVGSLSVIFCSIMYFTFWYIVTRGWSMPFALWLIAPISSNLEILGGILAMVRPKNWQQTES